MIRSRVRTRFAVSFASLTGLLTVATAHANFNPDLVIAELGANTHCAGDGTGAFACEPLVGPTDDSFAIAVGDIDGDNDLELVFGNNGGKNTICYGRDTPGTFSCATMGAPPPVTQQENATLGVAIGRIDGDQFPDIVFANRGSERDRVCLWLGMGLFNCADVNADPRSSADVALADVDGDGFLDALFASNASDESSRACLGDGQGGFSCSDIAGTTQASVGIAVSDFNQDGDLDAVIGNALSEHDLICAGNGDGTFACGEIDFIVRETYDVEVGEFNGDDDPDIVLVTNNNPADDPPLPSRICFGGAGLSFSCEELSAPPASTFRAAVADWNRDGADDIALANQDMPSMICLGANNGTFSCNNVSESTGPARGIAAVVPPPISPLEKDFEVEDNLDETGFENFEPEVSVLGNQGFVVVWRTVEGSETGLRANIAAPEGILYVDTIEIESITAGERYLPDVSIAQTGNFVVVWTYRDPSGEHPDASGSGVAGRLFNGSGTPVAGQFNVPTFVTGNQTNARVAMSPDESFMVVWDSTEDDSGMGVTAGRKDSSITRTPDGSGLSVMGRLFDGNGNAKTDEFIVSETTLNSQLRPHIAARRDGSYVVVWESLSPTFAADVFARIVEADGSMPAGEIPVHPPTLGEQQYPDVGVASDGRFVVTWQTPQDLDQSFGIRARVFDADGTPLTGEFEVNEPDGHDQEYPRVAFGAGRRFVIVWRHFDVPRERAEEIRAQEFEPTGRKVGEEFQVNTSIDELGAIGFPSVAGARDGRIVFAWGEGRRNDPSKSDIYRRRFENPNAPTTGTTTTSSTSSTTSAVTTTTSTTTTSLPPTTTSTTTTSISTPTSSVTTTTEIASLDCGDPVVDGTVTASDALFILSAAIGLENCETCVCDVNDSGTVTAADALAALSAAVGLDVELVCQPCI